MKSLPSLPFADADIVRNALPFPTLIDELQHAFATWPFTVPTRHHHEIQNPGRNDSSTLLLMPAWEPGIDIGLKVVTVTPHQNPAIHGIYLLINADNGQPQLLLDAPSLTAVRTAATSALASRHLSRPDSHTLFIAGSGTLAPELIRAHAAVRPIQRVLIWGRRPDQAEQLALRMRTEGFNTETVPSPEQGCSQADIISTATMSATPIVLGEWLHPGQHLDLVGSYRPHMREADDEVIRKSQLFADTRAGASRESGDFAIPLANGLMKPEDILADLHELCNKTVTGRRSVDDITLFKSVGHALEDLVAARLVSRSLH